MVGVVTVQLRGAGHRHDGIDTASPVVALVQSVAQDDAGGHHPADDGGVVDLGCVAVFVPQTLTQGQPGVDGQSGCALLQGEGQQGGEYEDPDQVELELCPRPGAGDHSAGAHRAGSQHRPVEEREELRAEVAHPVQLYQLSVSHWVISSGRDYNCTPGNWFVTATESNPHYRPQVRVVLRCLASLQTQPATEYPPHHLLFTDDSSVTLFIGDWWW